MKSIVNKVLQIEVTNILQTTYANITSLEIADHYLQKHLTTGKKILDIFPNEFPYNYYNIDIDTFKKSRTVYDVGIYRNCIVNLITTLENFCYDALERYFILDIAILAEENASFTFNELSNYMQKSAPEIALCKILVERKLRNEKTTNMLKKLGTYTKNGFIKKSNSDMIKIDRYSLIRNCIVHNQSRVSNDLISEYGSEFGSIDSPIDINHKMCVDLSRSILNLVSEFDTLFVKNIVKDNDAIALVKECFILKGFDTLKDYSEMIQNILGGKIHRESIEKAIAEVKKDKLDIKSDQISVKSRRLIIDYFESRY